MHRHQTFALLRLGFAMEFKQVWRALKSANWTALPVRGLTTGTRLTAMTCASRTDD